jgi:hypothetical protein
MTPQSAWSSLHKNYVQVGVSLFWLVKPRLTFLFVLARQRGDDRLGIDAPFSRARL